MSKSNNLTDFLTGVANAIRAKKGTSALINPQDFESEIASIGGGGGLEKYHIVQTINGDTCEIAITDYTSQVTDNYLVGVVVNGDNQKLYAITE